MHDRPSMEAPFGERHGAALDALPRRAKRPRPEPADEKALIRALFDGLEQRNVRYCHWKSNVRLRDTLAGRTDIDMLVDPRDAASFLDVLLRTGFRLTRPGIGEAHPGVFHALGLDDHSAELCDVHAYFQIVSGDSMVKSYRLPIERSLLEQCRHLHGVRVPEAAAELAIFAIRIALKHTSLVEARKCRRHYGAVVEELDWLLGQCRVENAAALCASWFPAIGRALFYEAIAAISDPDASMRRASIGLRMAWRLRPLRRLPGAAIQLSRLARFYGVYRKRVLRRRSLSLLTGGAIVALVGPKGTGKSTLATEAAARLGRYLDVRQIHAGKPPATLATRSASQVKPLLRRLLPGGRLSTYQKADRRHVERFSPVYVVRRLLLAYERRRLLRGAARAAASGCIVISDRYPSPTSGASDSSSFDVAALEAATSPAVRRLMERERSVYSTLPSPDIVLRLSAPLETAIARDATRGKAAGPNADAIRRRWRFEGIGEFPGAEIVQVDTDAPLEETVRAVVRAVWRAL